MDIEHAVREIQAAAGRVDEALAGVEAARQTLQCEALRALVEVNADEDRLCDLIRRLYWDVPGLPVKTLEAAVGPPARVRELAGPGPMVGACEDCGVELHASSRTQLATGLTCCKPCEKQRRAAERAAELAADAERRAAASRSRAEWYDDEGEDSAWPAEWHDRFDDLRSSW
jgi:hypothetical protein